jgi:hypothetical protein
MLFFNFEKSSTVVLTISSWFRNISVLSIVPDWVSSNEDRGGDTSKNELYNKMRLY